MKHRYFDDVHALRVRYVPGNLHIGFLVDAKRSPIKPIRWPLLVDTVVCGNQAKYDPQLSLDQDGIWTDSGDNCISDDCSKAPSPDLDSEGLVKGDDLELLTCLRGSPGIGDLNGGVMTDADDLGVLLAAWS